MGNEPTDEQVLAIGNALSSGNTIEAIKLYRNATGKGLKDAKEFIESLETELQPDKKSKPTQKTTPIGVIVLLVLLTLGGGSALSFASFRAMLLGKQSENWPSTRGNVVYVQSENSSRGRSARIEYSYVVDSQKYDSDTYSYRPLSDRIPISRYKQGQEVAVYYDPSNPALAVLLPGYQPHILRPLVGFVCLLISAYITKRGIREHKKRNC
jgi:hypothetical protein